MQPYYSMFISETWGDSTIDDCSNNFTVKKIFWNSDSIEDDDLYQQIVFTLFRKPNQLISHIQRIYFTYNRGWTEQLYAALVDLIWVLDGNGKGLSHRMILASHSQLSEKQLSVLESYIKQEHISIPTGNKFSVFSLGLVGTNILLNKQEDIAIEHDPLTIARDFVEYSQLDAAIETLETALLETPDRQELQTELLDLYKVTKNLKAFTKMRENLIQKELNLSSQWQELKDYFAEMTNEK